MNFSNIPGNDALKARLVKSFQAGRVSHAQLFAGPEGSGGLAMAMAYAQYLNCENRGEHDSCGTCGSCVKMSKFVHPDVNYVYPVNATTSVPSKRHPISDHFVEEWRALCSEHLHFNLFDWLSHMGIENKQGTISSHEAAAVVRKLSLKVYEGSYKIVLIWMPEYLHHVAANKLLKIIEEPPAKTVFILVSEDSEAIMGTIRSRVQMSKTARPTNEEMVTYLNLNGWNSDQRIVYLADGNLREAMYLIHHEGGMEHTGYFVSLMRMCYKKDLVGLLKWVEDIAKIGRENQKLFVQYSLRLLRDCNMIAVGCEQLVRLAPDELKFAKNIAPYVAGDTGLRIADLFNETFDGVVRNGNPKILFMDLALKVVKQMSLRAMELKKV